MANVFDNKWIRRSFMALGTVVILIVLLPCALYIPWVQNWAVDLACKVASYKTGLDVRVGRVSLNFPLDLSLDSVLVLDEHRDTMARVDNFTGGVEVMPLFHLELRMGDTRLNGGQYRMVSEDSSMTINASIDHARLRGAEVDLNAHVINVLSGEVNGGRVTLLMYPYKKVQQPDTAQSTPWRINALRLTVRNLDYTMQMLPTIDKLTAHIGTAVLLNGEVDTGLHTVHAQSLRANGLDCSYFTLNARDTRLYNRLHPLPPDTLPWTPNDTVTWQVRADTLALTASHALYATSGVQAKRGFDPDYIEASDINFLVTNLYNRGTSVKVPLQSLSASERSGLRIASARGLFSMDSTRIDVSGFSLRTAASSLSLTAHLPMAFLNNPQRSQFTLTTANRISLSEVALLVPALKPMLRSLPLGRPVTLSGQVSGNLGQLALRDVRAQIPGLAAVRASGRVTSPTDVHRVSGDLTLSASVQSFDYIQRNFLPATMRAVRIPPMTLQGHVAGSPRRLSIKSLTASMPGHLWATVSGTVRNVLDANRLSGDVAFNAQLRNVDFVKRLALTPAQQRQVNIPALTASGRARFDAAGNYGGNAAVRLASGGSLVATGAYSARGDRYSVNATASGFNARAFMPTAPVQDITGRVQATGHGFDFLSASTATNAKIDLQTITFNGQRYNDLRANVVMDGGNVRGRVASANPNCNLNLTADGRIQGTRYVFDVKGRVSDLDARAMGLTTVVCRGKGDVDMFVDYDTRTQHCNVQGNLDSLDFTYDADQFKTAHADVKLVSNDSTITAYLDNEDTHIDFQSPTSLNRFVTAMKASATLAQSQIQRRDLNINTLQDALPPFTLDLNMGSNGVVQRYLSKYDIDFRQIKAQARNDSTIYLDGYVHGLSYGTTSVDTLNFHANELSKYLYFNLHMGNRPGTWDDFAQVDVKGGAEGATVDFLVEQRNVKQLMGYRLGVNATLADNVVKARFFPHEPVIGYRQWTLNDSNFVNFNYTTRMLAANLQLQSDSSSVALTTSPTSDPNLSKVRLAIDRLRLGEWIPPGMTHMDGLVNADLNADWNGKNVVGTGTVSVKGFEYDHRSEGDVDLNTTLALDPANASTRVNGTLALDGSKVALVYGSLNDPASVTPLNLTAQLQHFPMTKATAFIPGGYLYLRGYLDGDLAVTGTLDRPLINGYVQGDSASVLLPRYGASVQLSDDRIKVDNGLINFKDYRIWGLNERAVAVNGDVNLNDFKLNLSLKGNNVQFVGTEQQPWSELFGKGFADVNATIKGNTQFMDVDAGVTLLTGSNLTYVLQDEAELTTGVDENMVTFVNPADSVAMLDSLVTAVGSSAFNLLCDITVQQGAKFGVYLSTDGKNRATIDGSGHLRYSIDFAGKDNMVGTYTIESGNVRYSPPIISQKNFDIASGSNLVWNGEVLNPQLNVTGTSNVKASVSGSDGNSRLVEFLVSASLGNSLNNIDLKFDMSAENDMTVANELQSMTDAQRSNAAINLLLYGTYSGTKSTGDVNLSTTGALYSFLQSQLNSWAAKTLKGVDLSFGINQYNSSDNGESSTQTSYSYRLSKTLFNDRFKIVVGGEYSTAAAAEQNFSDNLISDISIEYNLNPAGTKYFRLFRHTGWQDILEGEVTETGVGFVMKRKVSNLKHLFRYKSKERLAREAAAKQQKLLEEQQKQQPGNSEQPDDSNPTKQ